MGSALSIDEFFELLISLRINVTEREVFQLTAHLAHTEPVGKRSVNFHGLASDRLAAVGRKISERSHVVETIGELDHDDADVIGHGEEHLAEILSLLLLLGRELDLADLGYTIDDVSDFRTKQLFDLIQ